MPRRRCANRRDKGAIATPWSILLPCALACAAGLPTAARADTEAGSADQPAHTLMLETSVNGVPKGIIIELILVDGRLRTTPEELRAIGIDAGRLAVDAHGRVALDDIPGLKYSYRSDTQQLELRVDEARQIAERIGYEKPSIPPPQPAIGFVLNYSAHLQQTTSAYGQYSHIAGSSATSAGSLYNELSVFRPPVPLTSATPAPFDLGRSANDTFTQALGIYTDSRLFTPAGTLYNSGFVSLTNAQAPSDRKWIRMDTAWVNSDPAIPRTIVGGDFISTSEVGTRAVRLGGLQWRSDFELRPDLVTFPVPALGGSAVVPSTVDLYINNIRQFSGQASGGPFVIDAPPALTGAGLATIEVVDPTGRKVIATLPLYIEPKLLRAGLSDYALEAGWFRHDYGIESNDYAPHPVFNGVFRHGVSDELSISVAGEAAPGLVNAGAGALATLGGLGVLGAWVGASSGAASGEVGGIEYRYTSPRWGASLMETVARDDYRDLGSVDGVPYPPRELRGILSPSLGDRQNINFAYNSVDAAGRGLRIASIAYSANLGSRASFFAQAFDDLEDPRAHGAYVGLSINIGHDVTAYTNVSTSTEGTIASVGAAKSVDYDAGGFGWMVEGDADVHDGPYRHALVRGEYLGTYGDVQATAEKFDHAAAGMLDARGGLVFMDGTLMASRAVDDAFAMVSTDGVGGIPVLRENRVVGTTNDSGHFVIPDLQSFQANRLAIDTVGLPPDARVDTDHLVVTPRNGAGVLAHFPIDRYRGASVILVDGQGKPLPVGSHVTLQDGGSTAIVGYDGLVFFEELAPLNHLSVQSGVKHCSVDVPFDAAAAMTTIGPFVCALSEQAP